MQQLTFIKTAKMAGFVRQSYIIDGNILKLNFELYKILTNDDLILAAVENSILSDCSDDRFLNNTKVDLIHSIKLSKHECNIYLKDINTDDGKITLPGMQQKILLDDDKKTDIFLFITSFIMNYAIIKHLLLLNNSTTNITPTDAPLKNIGDKPVDYIDEILKHCPSNSLKTFFVNYFMTNFSGNNDYDIKEIIDDIININVPAFLPNSVDIEFISNALIAKDCDSEQLEHFLKKILLQVVDISNKEELLLLSFMYLIYSLKCAAILHPTKINLAALESILKNSDTQRKFLSWSLNNITSLSNFKDKIKFNIITITNNNDNKITDRIQQLSEKYNHLKLVDQKEFANRIFTNLSEDDNNPESIDTTKFPSDFSFTKNTILDINKLLVSSTTKNINLGNNLFNQEKDDISNMIKNTCLESNLLSYKISNINKSIISIAYEYFINYLNEPNIILTLENKSTGIPKTIIKLFPLLAKIINGTNFTKDNNILFNYYKILMDKIPNAQLLSHLTILYMIYQLIIPFMYENYNMNIFYDIFL